MTPELQTALPFRDVRDTRHERRAFDRTGILAIDPRAFGALFDAPVSGPELVRGVPVVDVRGPLDHHSGGWFDNYDAIVARVAAACQAAGDTVVMRIDSPGGDMAGCCEAAQAIRSLCAAAGKRLVAYVDGTACSAGYALACAAEAIIVPQTGIVGSIGVISVRCDVTAAAASEGVRHAMIVSGARKADGNPMQALSVEELASTQAMVDSMAGVFFAFVEISRGIPADQIKAMEAGLFHGAGAVAAGLADRVWSFDELLSALARGENMKAIATMDEARSALTEIAKGDGAAAKSAQRALAAMEEPEPEAEGEPVVTPEEKEEEAAPAATVSAPAAAALATHANGLQARVEQLEKRHEATERAALLASRPDLSPALRAVFEGQPLADVRATIAAIPKPVMPKPAASAVVAGTRGDTQGADTAARMSPAAKALLDQQMGISATQSIGVLNTPHAITLGAPVAINTGKVG